MPVVPGTEVGGEITCMGKKVNVKPTRSLAIYHVGEDGAKEVF